MQKKTHLLGMAMVASLGLAASVAAAEDLRFMCSSDGNECEVIEAQMARFHEANPDINVVVDNVPYKAILENLPIQLAAGSGPDIAKVTDLGGLSSYYLDVSPYVDAQYWQDTFGDILNWYRPKGDEKGIYGVHSQLTITGAYINRTLFDQAEVAVPSAEASWDEWVEATKAVAKATETKYIMAMDRSGHRIAGPAISNGAKMFAEDGTPFLVDEGFTDYVKQFVAWNQEGTMAPEVWGGKGGTAYQDASQEFISGQLVYYYSGSWQVGKFDKNIGDAFDWQVVGSPCGPGGCSGMPGGSGIVGFKSTKQPEAVAKVLDFLAQEANYAELTAETRNIPAHAAVAAKGVEYGGASTAAAAALNAWGAQVANISPVAYQYQGYSNNRAMFNISLTRISQAIAGEMTVDEAMERAKDDLAKALEEAK